MNINRLSSGFTAIVITLQTYIDQGWQSAAIIVAGLCIILSMIWRGDLWAQFVLPTGFWESKATDFKQGDNQGPVMALFGWVLLLLVLFAVYW